MNSTQRREEIARLLQSSNHPVAASALAAALGVSRQVIVGDVALLRAAGMEISATPRGYVLAGEEEKREGLIRTIACVHDNERMAEEIYTVVDNGGAMLDVIVEHSLYGQITGQLHIFSRFDADQFIQKAAENGARPLSYLTGGIHLHTIRCKDEETFRRVLSALAKKGFLLSNEHKA